MMLVVQKHRLGCGVACVASLLDTTYDEALLLFPNGRMRAIKEGFYCEDVVEALKQRGFHYRWEQLEDSLISKPLPVGTIVFVENKKKYRYGHYLLRTKGWMDSWINYPNSKRKAGFRKNLP